MIVCGYRRAGGLHTVMENVVMAAQLLNFDISDHDIFGILLWPKIKY